MSGKSTGDASWDLEMEFKFCKGKPVKLSNEINSISITYDNYLYVPRLAAEFYLDTKHCGMLMMPYEITLTIVEKGTVNRPTSVLKTEWLSLEQKSENIRREEEISDRPDRSLLKKVYIQKDPYSVVTSKVGGLWEDVTVFDVVEELWGQTNHGSLELVIDRPEDEESKPLICIPKLEFHRALNYLASHYGLYNTQPMVYTEENKFFITTTNKRIKAYKDIKLATEAAGTNTKVYKLDKREYCVPQVPSFSNTFNTLGGVFAKETSVITRTSSLMYGRDSINMEEILNAQKHVDTTDIFDDFTEKFNKPETMAVSGQADVNALKENYSAMLTNATQPFTVKIPEPFRLSHWKIGSKVQIEPNHASQISGQVTGYVSNMTLSIKRTDSKRLKGFIHANVKLASTKNIKV